MSLVSFQALWLKTSMSVSVCALICVFVSDCINSSVVKVRVAESRQEEWQETFNQR